MNYLVHLYLSDPDPDCLLGNLLGDFVKGRLDQHSPPALRRGLMMHRRLDSFAHTHPACRRSRLRLSPSFGHYRAIMVDIAYDHILARHWRDYHPQPLPVFAAGIYALIEANFHRLPSSFQPVARAMISHDWLTSYREPKIVDRVLERISGRLRQPNPLVLGGAEVLRHIDGLTGDCREFLGDARGWLDEVFGPGGED